MEGENPIGQLTSAYIAVGYLRGASTAGGGDIEEQLAPIVAALDSYRDLLTRGTELDPAGPPDMRIVLRRFEPDRREIPQPETGIQAEPQFKTAPAPYLADVVQEAMEPEPQAAPEGEKICKSCGKSKPLSAFPKHPQCKDGIDARCRECKAKMVRERRRAKRAAAAETSTVQADADPAVPPPADPPGQKNWKEKAVAAESAPQGG